MTRSRTTQALAGLSLLAVLFSAACGGDDSDDGGSDSAPPPASSGVAPAPPPPVAEVAARPDLDPCVLLDGATADLGLPAEPTDTQENEPEGKLCTWKQDQRTVVVSLYNGSIDEAATGLGVTGPAAVDVAGTQARQFAEPTGCVLLFALSGNRTLVVVASNPGADNCQLSTQAAQTAIPRVA